MIGRGYRTKLEYDIGDDYVPADAVRDMPQEQQAAFMTHWMQTHFEDPCNQMPYDSDEGEYVFIYGGPYDAYDELYDVFGGVVADEVIVKTAEALNLICMQWSPVVPDQEWEPDLERDPIVLDVELEPDQPDF